MSKRQLAIPALVAALGLGTPAVMADQGDEGHKHQHGNKHFDDDHDQDSERRDGHEYRTYRDHDERPPGRNRGKKPGWATAVYLPAKPRSTAVGATHTAGALIITNQKRQRGSSFDVRSLRF